MRAASSTCSAATSVVRYVELVLRSSQLTEMKCCCSFSGTLYSTVALCSTATTANASSSSIIQHNLHHQYSERERVTAGTGAPDELSDSCTHALSAAASAAATTASVFKAATKVSSLTFHYVQSRPLTKVIPIELILPVPLATS